MGRPPCGLEDYQNWQERIEDYEASGLSIEEFCQQEEVSKTTFYRWVNQLREGRGKLRLGQAWAKTGGLAFPNVFRLTQQARHRLNNGLRV